jgi:hypothetical protein
LIAGLPTKTGPTKTFYFEPTQTIFLIDHEKAFLNGNGKQHLQKHENGLCVHWDNHCLAQDTRSLVDFDEWNDRINSLPEFFIHDTVMEAHLHGLPYDDIDYCTKFLIDRRAKLKSLFRQFKDDAFPELEPNIVDPFVEPPEPSIDYCHLGI